jgi:hypothetical protein
MDTDPDPGGPKTFRIPNTALHPVDGVAMADHVHLVHGDDEGELALVEDGAGVEHVGHEGDWAGGAHAVHDIDDEGGEAGGQRLCDNVARGGPGEHLDLACRVTKVGYQT